MAFTQEMNLVTTEAYHLLEITPEGTEDWESLLGNIVIYNSKVLRIVGIQISNVIPPKPVLQSIIIGFRDESDYYYSGYFTGNTVPTLISSLEKYGYSLQKNVTNY